MLDQAQQSITLATRGPGLYEMTREVAGWTEEQGLDSGLLTVFLRHTSASLIIQENADPDVQRDLADFFGALAPEDPARYRHRAEGPDDMPAHLRAAVLPVSLSIPVTGGRLSLGTWQGIFLVEHRDAPHRRRVAAHLSP